MLDCILVVVDKGTVTQCCWHIPELHHNPCAWDSLVHCYDSDITFANRYLNSLSKIRLALTYEWQHLNGYLDAVAGLEYSTRLFLYDNNILVISYRRGNVAPCRSALSYLEVSTHGWLDRRNRDKMATGYRPSELPASPSRIRLQPCNYVVVRAVSMGL